MKQRWQLLALGAAAVTLGGTTVARAVETSTETIVIPAPPSKASAVALELEDLIVIAQTAATSGQSGGEASANALGLLGGGTLIEGTTGGTQEGTGTSSGALLELQQGPAEQGDIDLELTPWDLAVTQTSANARAALLRLFLGDLATAALLQSESHTTYSPQTSTAKSSSDAVYLCLLGDCASGEGLELVLLHSETSESHSGLTYILRINDTEIPSGGSNGQGADPCSLALGDQSGGLLHLQALCTSASGGTGQGGTTVVGNDSSVADASVGGETVAGHVVGTTSSGGSAPIVTPAPAPADNTVVAAPDSSGAVSGAVTTAPAADTAASGAAGDGTAGGVLARTGRAITHPLFFGSSLVLAGLTLLGLRRGRRPAQ